MPLRASGRHWEKALRADLHLGEGGILGRKGGEKGAVRTARPAQQLEVAAQAFVNGLLAHVLEVDCDLGADHIDAQHGRGSTPVHASADRMSEAVKSAGFSGGGVAISPDLHVIVAQPSRLSISGRGVPSRSCRLVAAIY